MTPEEYMENVKYCLCFGCYYLDMYYPVSGIDGRFYRLDPDSHISDYPSQTEFWKATRWYLSDYCLRDNRINLKHVRDKLEFIKEYEKTNDSYLEEISREEIEKENEIIQNMDRLEYSDEKEFSQYSDNRKMMKYIQYLKDCRKHIESELHKNFPYRRNNSAWSRVWDNCCYTIASIRNMRFKLGMFEGYPQYDMRPILEKFQFIKEYEKEKDFPIPDVSKYSN
jgi:hypothetical protein